MSELSERDKWIARNCYTAGWMDRGPSCAEGPEAMTDEEIRNLTEFAPAALTWRDKPR